jgi:ATP-dependent helicase/nuclease subunit A
MLNDSLQRAKATDPCNSYIVQAPAGSGKTEILTQRYLRLLGGVTAPEQIIALTFTRKAANEMRERILRALQQAAKGVSATSSHQQQTLAFATAALERDSSLHWQLLQQPNRLRIITIDSLCQTLTHAIPLQDKQVPYAQISDKPQSHYMAAARACYLYALENTDYHPCLKTLLRHLDNRQDNLLTLLAKLLANRDQWLHLLYQAKEQNKESYEHALAQIEHHELTRLQHSIPKELAEDLTCLMQRLTSIQSYSDSPLQNWKQFNQLDRQIVSHLAAILLTSQNTLRKALDHHVGLKRGECSDTDYNELKTKSKQLFSDLAEQPDFLSALIRVKNLPPPHYNSEQWDVLQSLLTLLPLLAAHLQIIFSTHDEVDFSAISEQALLALGDDESPTDLALYLDNSIHHLLVDEFQDTSILQFQLLSKLVQSWQPNDGKTLFVVGDPMQSIYRFRSAEVGLFLRARDQGIGPVTLTPLELNCNFRSTATIVNWVNDQFKSIFPQTNDIESGAIAFHPSTHIKPADAHSCVMSFQYADKVQEAQALVERIVTELEEHPSDEIAILVRSRNQLAEIVRCLREQHIPFQGIEIDLLAQLPHLRDVWSLTQALLMPGNRLAWLALLRSPWCGLSLNDLLCIAQYSKHESIYHALSKLPQIADLSEHGRTRAHFIYTALENALANRHQQQLIPWITNTLKQLHLEKILDTSQQNDVEQYWLLLERFEKHGQIEDLTQFNQEFNRLYSQQVVPSRLKIMTIHKSKGLEFDCVILPGLSTRPPSADTPLLRWLKLPSHNHGELLLISPIKAAHHEECSLYDYLGRLDAQKNGYELQRLLYVAATRAKKRLYLFDNNDKFTQGTFRHLLQNHEFVIAETPKEIPALQTNVQLPSLYQLPIHFYEPNLLSNSTNPANEIPSITTNTTPRLIGIVVHEMLQWICDHHPTTSAEIPWELANHQLKCSGLDANTLQAAQHQLKLQLTQFFNDPVGQWLIKKHDNECNEYELLVEEHNELVTKIIDRTFCENGVRWIIDFKTGLDDEKAEHRHRQQVDEYAHLFVNGEQNSIHCGLYYLASNRWLAWEYVTHEH